MAEEKVFTCSDCKLLTCKNKEGNYPKFCLTTNLDEGKLNDVLELYKTDEEINKIAVTSAEIEGEFYGKKTRVEETIEFMKRMGVKKIGIASCVGLMAETSMFTKILDKYNLKYYTVGCKIGAVDKGEIGITDEFKLNRGCGHESMCNPIMQAKLLNEEKTDFNIIIGLCVGHDMLFTMHSEAPVTTLIAKDRVLIHNPVAALYSSTGMYSRFK